MGVPPIERLDLPYPLVVPSWGRCGISPLQQHGFDSDVPPSAPTRSADEWACEAIVGATCCRPRHGFYTGVMTLSPSARAESLIRMS